MPTNIINNRLFDYFYDRCGIYTCTKYFVASVYIYRIVLNFTYIITTVLVKFQNVSLIDYLHKKFLLVFEYFFKQLYFSLIAYIKQLISPIPLFSSSPNSYLVSRPESFHRSNNLYSARLNAVTPSETRRLCAPRSTASRQPTPVGETRSVKNQTPPLTFEISLHAGQAHDLLSLGRRGIVDEGWRDTFGGRDTVHRKGHSQLNEHWIKRDRLGGRIGMGDAKGGRAGWRGAAVGKDHEINMYVGGCGPRGSGVASNCRLLIGQRPPHGHAHSHTRCLKASTKRQPPYIPWWTATAKAEGRWGWLDARCQHSLPR